LSEYDSGPKVSVSDVDVCVLDNEIKLTLNSGNGAGRERFQRDRADPSLKKSTTKTKVKNVEKFKEIWGKIERTRIRK